MPQTVRRHSVIAALILGSAVLSPLALAADSSAVDSKIGTTVTINGCLHAGKGMGQFVLVGVTEKTADGLVAPVPYAIYMLDSTRDMKPLVGELVDITGKVLKRESQQGAIKIEVHADDERTTDVKVETESKDMKAKGFDGSATAEPSVIELSRPVYKVHVETVEAIQGQYGPACK